jgi:WD40 repeat protein
VCRICPDGVNPSDQRAGCSGNTKITHLETQKIAKFFFCPLAPVQPANAQSLKVDSLGISFVMTASRDKTIKLWDALRGQCLWTFVILSLLKTSIFII